MDKCPKSKNGNNNPNWNGGRCQPEKRYGYIKIYAPHHPRSCKGYVYEHTLMAEKALGKYLPPKSVVHHHTLSQIVVCQDQSYHRLLHQRMKSYEACGHANWRKCQYCKKWDSPDKLMSSKKSQYHRKCKTQYQKIHRMVKKIAALKERLEAWRATKPFFLMTPDILWEYGGEPEEIYQRLKSLNEL